MPCLCRRTLVLYHIRDGMLMLNLAGWDVDALLCFWEHFDRIVSGGTSVLDFIRWDINALCFQVEHQCIILFWWDIDVLSCQVGRRCFFSWSVTLMLLCVSRVRELQELWRTVKTSSQWSSSYHSTVGLSVTDISFHWPWTCRSHDCFKDFAVWILFCYVCLQLGTYRTHKQCSFEQTSVCMHPLWKGILSEWALQRPHEHAQ